MSDGHVGIVVCHFYPHKYLNTQIYCAGSFVQNRFVLCDAACPVSVSKCLKVKVSLVT